MNRKKFSLYHLVPRLFLITLLFACAGEAQADQALPTFAVPVLGAPGVFNSSALQGHVILLNVWASWCGFCREEHPMLLEIQKKYHIPIYGVDFEDNSDAALNYLAQFGNPYVMVGIDKEGAIANSLQVSGTPETFIIDKHGVIRYRHIGYIDKKSWVNEFLPLINQYQNET